MYQVCELQTYFQFPRLSSLKKIPPEHHLSALQDTNYNYYILALLKPNWNKNVLKFLSWPLNNTQI